MPDNYETSQPVGEETLLVEGLEDFVLQPDSSATVNAFTDDAPSSGVLTTYRGRTFFLLNDHTYQLPIASPNGFGGAFSSIVQLAAPTAKLAFEWVASKIGSKPQAVTPYVSDPNIVFLPDSNLVTETVDAGGDGQAIYTFSGTYRYAVKNRTAMSVSAAVPPWVVVQGDENVLNADDFISGVLNAGWPNPASSSQMTQS